MYNFYPKKLVQPPGCAPNILLIMKLTTLILVAAILQVSAATYAQKITLTEKNTPLNKVFEKISDQTGFDFIISTENLKFSRGVTINVENQELKVVLDNIFSTQLLTFIIQERMVVVSKKPNSNTVKEYLPVTINGKVTDSAGMSLPGATVRIKGSPIVITTDSQGAFNIMAKEGDEIEISYIGFQSSSFIVKKDEHFHNVILSVIPSKLNEIQIIGYGTVSKKLNTGSVSTLNASDISDQPIVNLLSAVSGRVAGVNVQTSNGLPGGGVSIQIRGRGSILAGTDPLYIVDGVPFPAASLVNNTTLSGGINGAPSPFNSINPDDIETISILKDADATAIYGSRGANGVVIITTKKGKAGQTKVNFNISNGINKAANLPQLLNLSQYLQIRNEAFKNDGLIPSSNPLISSTYAPDLTVWDTTKSTNWAKYILGNTGHVTDVQAGVTGGSLNTSFAIGSNFHTETTIIPGDNLYQREGFHMNLQHSSENKKFSISFSGSYTTDNNKLANFASAITGFVLLPPDFPLYDQSGNLNWGFGSNPLAAIKQVSKTKTNNLIANTSIKYTLIPGLNIKSSIGYNRLGMDQVMTYPKSSQNPANSPTSYSYFGNNYNQSFIIEPQIDYTVNLRKSTLSLLVGGTWQESQKGYQFITANGYSNESLMENLSSATTYVPSTILTDYKYVSVFGRANYNFDDKYILNATIRRDGSSRFGPGNQFGNFGSVGTAWLFSNENFIKNTIPYLSFGKLRASYGITGNDQITDYQYLSTYGSSSYIYQGIATLQPSRISNADYQWETTKKLEVALELGFAKEVIFLTIGRYQNRSSNELVNYAIPYQTGFNSYQANLPAVIENTGWEFELATKNVRNKAFTWSTNFNLTIPKNILKSFQDFTTSSYSNIYVIGESITRTYGYQLAGLDPSKGTPLYSLKAGGQSATPTSPDFYYTLGQKTPSLFGGIGNNFSYKGLQLNIFGQFIKQQAVGGLANTPGRFINNYIIVANRWQTPGDETVIPKASTKSISYYSSSSANFFDASYFRLKTVSLSYNLPAIWLKRINVEQVRFYINGENLYTWWKKDLPFYDPETGSGLNAPPVKSLVAGIQITL
jgi:TonB-linked SusC/RagA family outer membrane protein